MRSLLLTSAAVIAFAAPAAAQVTVSTGTPTNAVAPFGKDAAFGTIPTAVAQTFATPTGFDYLQSFSFFMSGFINGSALLLDASVYEFSGDHLVGPALFQSALVSGTDSFDNEILTFGTATSPLNVHLTPGTMYALVLSSLGGYASTPDGSTIFVGATDSDLYAGGSGFVSVAASQAELSAPGAFIGDVVPDLAFNAVFTNQAVVVTPEPATLTLLVTGLAGLGGYVKRRKRGQAIR